MALSLLPGQRVDINEAEPLLDRGDPKALIADRVCTETLLELTDDTSYERGRGQMQGVPAMHPARLRPVIENDVMQVRSVVENTTRRGPPDRPPRSRHRTVLPSTVS
nr:hypothetical protein [Acetobacter aceti]